MRLRGLCDGVARGRAFAEGGKADRRLAAFRSVAIDNDVFRRAGSLLRHYRASHGLDISDALVAATAEHHGLVLATLNVKHFPMLKRLKAAC